MKKAILSKKFPKSDLPFSHGFRSGNFVFTSGQVGVNPETGESAEGIEEQTRQTLENIETILKETGYSRKDVVKATVFLADIRDYNDMIKFTAISLTNLILLEAAWKRSLQTKRLKSR